MALRPRRPMLSPRIRPLASLVVGFAGAGMLSIVTSRGFLHAAVVTGAGYTGSVEPVGPAEQALMVVAWILIGGLAGYVGRTSLAFGALWVGALAGTALGFLGDPQTNVLWIDMVVSVVGVTMFVAPGFYVGAQLAAWRERQEPDGSGRRPAPPPLWTRGAAIARRTATTMGDHRPMPARQPPGSSPHGSQDATYPPSSYARPGSHGSE